MTFRTGIDAIMCILIRESINYCNLSEELSYILFLEITSLPNYTKQKLRRGNSIFQKEITQKFKTIEVRRVSNRKYYQHPVLYLNILIN